MQAKTVYSTLIAIIMAAPSQVLAIETTGLAWCDRMLASYESCLNSVTHEKCEIIARRDKRSATYQLAGAFQGAQVYPTAAHACDAEVRDLIDEARFNAAVIAMADEGQRDKACRVFKRLVFREARAFCGILASE